MTANKKLSKINRLAGSGSTGYYSDNACIAFGDPLELIQKRNREQRLQTEYRNQSKKDK
jgi:hypothetical protein